MESHGTYMWLTYEYFWNEMISEVDLALIEIQDIITEIISNGVRLQKNEIFCFNYLVPFKFNFHAEIGDRLRLRNDFEIKGRYDFGSR
jgi:hypothetical protein